MCSFPFHLLLLLFQLKFRYIRLKAIYSLPIVIWLRQSLNNEYYQVYKGSSFCWNMLCSWLALLLLLHTNSHTHTQTYINTHKNLQIDAPLEYTCIIRKKTRGFSYLSPLHLYSSPFLPPKSWHFSAFLISFCLLPPPSPVPLYHSLSYRPMCSVVTTWLLTFATMRVQCLTYSGTKSFWRIILRETDLRLI